MSETTKRPRESTEADLPDFDGEFAEVSVVTRTDRRSSFKGRDVASSQWVFIKMLSKSHSDSPAAVEFFHNEPTMLSMLSEQMGAGMVSPVLRSAFWRGRPYFVQSFVPGWALSKAMQTCAAFNVRHALGVLEDCLRVLDKIHVAGIVHGDVSPENIHIATNSPARTDGTLPDSSTVRLVDFESARRVDGSENRYDYPVIAKAPYLAPEIAEGKPLSPQSDLFGLGVLLYELLVGSRPYEVHTLEDLCRLSASSIKPMPLVYEIPQLIEDLVSDLIAPAPADRLQSAAAALDRVRQLKDLVGCLNHTGPRDVNRKLGRGKGREIADYVEATTRRAAESGRVTRSSVDYLSGDFLQKLVARTPLKSRAGVHTDGVTLGSVPLLEQVRRKEISSYLAVPLLDAKGKEDLVDFSVFAPAGVVPGASFILDLWAYLPEAREQMVERATRQKRKVEIGSRGGLEMSLNVRLSLSLSLARFVVEKPAASLYWTGNTSNVSFLVRTPPELPPGLYAGHITVLHNGMLLVQLLFEVEVHGGPRDVIDVRDLKTKAQRVRSAFASYSSKDRREVKKRVQGMAAVGVDVFLDVVSLRAGQMWEQELLKNIKERDIFYLFWSPHARESKYVEREWRFALSERGLGFIHPVALTDLSNAPPPPELNRLHFGDILLTGMGEK